MDTLQDELPWLLPRRLASNSGLDILAVQAQSRSLKKPGREKMGTPPRLARDPFTQVPLPQAGHAKHHAAEGAPGRGGRAKIAERARMRPGAGLEETGPRGTLRAKKLGPGGILPPSTNPESGLPGKELRLLPTELAFIMINARRVGVYHVDAGGPFLSPCIATKASTTAGSKWLPERPSTCSRTRSSVQLFR